MQPQRNHSSMHKRVRSHMPSIFHNYCHIDLLPPLNQLPLLHPPILSLIHQRWEPVWVHHGNCQSNYEPILDITRLPMWLYHAKHNEVHVNHPKIQQLKHFIHNDVDTQRSRTSMCLIANKYEPKVGTPPTRLNFKERSRPTKFNIASTFPQQVKLIEQMVNRFTPLQI